MPQSGIENERRMIEMGPAVATEAAGFRVGHRKSTEVCGTNEWDGKVSSVYGQHHHVTLAGSQSIANSNKLIKQCVRVLTKGQK